MAKEKKASAKCCKSKCASAPAPAAAPAPAVSEVVKPLTKTQMLQALSESVGLSRKDVTAVVEGLSELIKTELSKGDNASFTLPGLIKIEKQFVPAREGQKHVPDPFHPGSFIDRPAKEEHYKIKVKALKALKDMA